MFVCSGHSPPIPLAVILLVGTVLILPHSAELIYALSNNTCCFCDSTKIIRRDQHSYFPFIGKSLASCFSESVLKWIVLESLPLTKQLGA